MNDDAEPFPDDPVPSYACCDCEWGCQTPPAKCPKCGCCAFDIVDAYTAPACVEAARKARLARAMAEDEETQP